MKDSRINRVIRTGESVERSEFKITHVTDPEEGPVDGCSVETRGVHTKFKEKGLYGREKTIFRQQETEVSMKASVSIGVVSITDKKRDTMITVSISEMAALLNEALRTGARMTAVELDGKELAGGVK